MRIEKVTRDPRPVRNTGRVQFARGEHHLLQPSVDRVTVDVKVANCVERGETLVEREPIAHLRGFELSHVAKRGHIRFDILGADVADLEVDLVDGVEAKRGLGGIEVALDIGQFAAADVRLHNEPLDDGRIHRSGNQRNDGPESDGEDRQTPPTLAHVPQEQERDGDRDEDHQVECRQLRLHVGVCRALHDTTSRPRQVETLQPVVGRTHEG